MLSNHRFAWSTGLLVAAVAAVATLASVSTGQLAATFSGALERGRVSTHSFTVPHDATIAITLTGLGPSDARIGFGLGTPTMAGNCAIVEAVDTARVTEQIGGALRRGTYCVALYDSGNVTSSGPLQYTVRVTEQ